MFTSDSEDLEMMLPDGNETMALGNEFASGNPVLAAQQIKNCIREADWIYLLRKCLYGERNSKEIQISPLVDRLAAICGEPGCVQAVVNYNYDSIFEDYLSLKSIKYVVRSEADQRGKPRALPIYHVHGYLKRRGGPKTKIVLAEDDYHANLAAPHSWSNLLQSSFLARSTCIFIGTSMTDQNMRRILRSAVGVGNRVHYAFLPSDVTSERAIMANSLFDQDLRTLGVLAIRVEIKRILHMLGYLDASTGSWNKGNARLSIASTSYSSPF